MNILPSYELWEWGQLMRPHTFDWRVGITPLSNLQASDCLCTNIN
jgi:hypothetical protein